MIYKIIPKKCIACGLCQIKAPLFFDYYDDGIVKLRESDKKECLIEEPIPIELMEAIKRCPTRAIRLKKASQTRSALEQ